MKPHASLREKNALFNLLLLTGTYFVACATTPPPPIEPAASRPTSTAVRVGENTTCNDWEIYFATGSAELSPETRNVLHRLAQCVRSDHVREVSVVGGADPRGTEDNNLTLGQQRADAIRGVLVAEGCRPEVVRAYSVGESNTSGATDTYANERRVSVRTRERASP